jgi:bifunctional DNA primase/polymerase-like protein/primase-like protein
MTFTHKQVTEIEQRTRAIEGSREAWNPIASPALTDTQLTALDLYSRGLNVIPLKHYKKKPYILAPFFTARLHHCGMACHHKGHDDISELFRRKNIGIITGRTSGNLLAIDCDSQPAFAQMRHELTARKLPFWAISGHRGGAYLLRVIEGEVGNMPKGRSFFADVELWGHRHLIVVPPSIHPLGDVYQWVTPEPRFYLPAGESIPAVSLIELDFLGAKLDLHARKEWEEPELYGLPKWAAALSQRNRQTYADELTEGERNNRIFALACDMHGIGVSYHEAERYIMDCAARAGMPRREARSTFKSAYQKEREPARRSGGGVREWQRAKMFASLYDWRGTFGKKALKRQAAYLACVERARQDGRIHFRATAREVAELIPTDKKRAAEYLTDLTKAKLIKRVNDVTHKDAGIYRFLGLSEVTTLYTTGSYSVVSLDTPKSQAELDVFGKIGLVSWHVWRYLLKQPAKNAGEISHKTGLPRSSVYAALKVLTHGNVGLAGSAEGMYYGEPRTDASLASMAAFWHDGASPSQNRKQVHKLERERRVNRLVISAIQRAEA